MTLSDILTAISQFMQYTIFEINRTAVTPMSVILLIVVIFIFVGISKLLRRILLKKVFPYLNLDQGTSYTFSRIVHYLIMVTGAIVAFQFIGIDFSGLAVIFGFLSVGIGFGLQNVTSNFVAGLILLIERPIKVGDRVTVGDSRGDVEEINIRSTTIRSENNVSIIVPNSEFVSTTVINWSHGDRRVLLDIEVGVSYNSNLENVLRCLAEVAEEHKTVLKNPGPQVHLANFGDSSWNMQLRVWIADPKDYRRVRSELNCAIVRKFRENQVEIPFPQRDLHVRTPLPLPVSQDSPLQN